MVILLNNFIQQRLNSDSVQGQNLFAACQRFAMVRIFDNNRLALKLKEKLEQPSSNEITWTLLTKSKRKTGLFFIVKFELTFHRYSLNYLLKVNNSNTRTRCEICLKLTIKIPERRQWRRSGIFIVNFKYISHLVSIVNFEHVIAGWHRACSEKIGYITQFAFGRNQNFK